MPLSGCICTCHPECNIPVRNVNLDRLDGTAVEHYAAMAIVHIVHMKQRNDSSTGNSIQIQLTGWLMKIGDGEAKACDLNDGTLVKSALYFILHLRCSDVCTSKIVILSSKHASGDKS